MEIEKSAEEAEKVESEDNDIEAEDKVEPVGEKIVNLENIKI